MRKRRKMLIPNLIKPKKRESKIGAATRATAVTDNMLMTRCAAMDRTSIASQEIEVSLVQTRKTMANGSIKRPTVLTKLNNSSVLLS